MLAIFGLSGAPIFHHRDSGAHRELLNHRDEIEVLVIHHKTEDAPSRTTAETVEGLALLTDVKRRRLFLVKWTKRLVARARPLEREIRADDLDDVVGRGDLLDSVCGDGAHGAATFRSFHFAAGGKLMQRGPPSIATVQTLVKTFPVLLLAATFALVPTSARSASVLGPGDVVVVPLRGEVAPPMFLFLRRVQKAAESARAGALILEMNTYGGRLDSAEKITNLL